MKTHTVLAIGAHVGDAELTAGALLATCAVHGGKAVTLALTAGEKGAPIGADIAAYRADKIAQAEAFARDLGGEAYVLQYEDGLVPDNDEIRFAVCDRHHRDPPCPKHAQGPRRLPPHRGGCLVLCRH